MEYGGPPYQKLSRATEMFDFTVFDFPNANISDAGTEEIEIDQALSLADRRGRRFFGAQFEGLLFDAYTELLTDAGVLLEVTISIATRTGDFHIDDPELLANYHWEQFLHTAGTNTEAAMLQGTEHLKVPPNGSIYVAPRLFFRVDNDQDSTIGADTLFTRIATISQPLTFRVFIELLERFADVTLL